MFPLDSFLRAQQERVEALLNDRSERLRPAGTPPRLLEAMRYSLMAGGKRLRPVLCLTFADTVARASVAAPAAEDAACALEYVHTYSLIHDDLPAMDDDDLRRGRPTSHKVYGEAMAILAGDALLTEAFTLVASGTEPMRAALCAELAQAAGAAGMVGGQVLDIAEDRPAELDYLLRLHRLKTGALIRASCRMGVLAGGGDAQALARADIYGSAVGLAFQIADDVLDVTSSAEVMGKPVGADAEAGRFTFPAVLGLEASRRMAREKVDEAVEAVRFLEGEDGPLAALARFTVERSS
ncbi:polyprenyl synthetase family protein [Myxococcaceae bacterium JPH2]|nr:polyprenyl synthetase family protein [Myxococcaceae bacterium JPH2]